MLHLLRTSPRTSYDLDLVPQDGTPPGLAEVVPGDLFDVWHLLELGASLDQAQWGWLEDRLATQEMEFADVRHRLESLPAQKLATSLLRQLKPEQRAFWNERKAAVAVGRVTKFLREELG